MSDNPDLIQRNRIGQIRHLDADGKFGFIEAEDFRDDVFFHLSVWENPQAPPELKMVVEFELDGVHFREKNQLRAKVVRKTNRPFTQQLFTNERLRAKHHPNARKRKPTWRKKN